MQNRYHGCVGGPGHVKDIVGKATQPDTTNIIKGDRELFRRSFDCGQRDPDHAKKFVTKPYRALFVPIEGLDEV